LRHQAHTLYYRHVCILVFMYLRFPCYCDACLNSSDLRVGLKTLLNTTIQHEHMRQWRSQTKIFLGARIFYFRRATVFCLGDGDCLLKYIIARHSKYLGAWPRGHPWLRLWR